MLKITLEGGVEDIESFVGPQQNSPDIVLMAKRFSLISCDINRSGIAAYDVKVVLEESTKPKSQEEAIAEAAVRKAKESLKAAEANLKKIKEKK